MKDLGYSMNTGVLPVGRLPHALRRDNRYFGERRLSLLVICLENQGNDSSNEHAELKNPFPCNIHTCHPLSFTIGGKEASPPKKSRETAYRGTTGSTMDSISHDSTDCKGKSVGCIARQGAVQADTANGAKPQSRGAAVREERRPETANFAKKGLPNGAKHVIMLCVSGRRAPRQHWDVAKR